MSRNGGYKIIDLKNKELKDGGDVGVVFEGIYDAIEGTRKPLLISGLNIDGKEIHDFYGLPYLEGTNYVIVVPGSLDTFEYNLTINDNDVVKCSSF